MIATTGLLVLAYMACLASGCSSTPGRERALDPVMQTAFCADGKRMVVSTTTSEVALFDVFPLRFRSMLSREEWKTRVSLAGVLRSPPVACSPDSRLAVAAGVAGRLLGWDLDSGQLRFNVAVDGRVRGLAFFPDGSAFMVVGDTVRRHSAATGLVLDEFGMPAGTRATAVAVSPDGESVLAGLSNGRIVEINARSRQVVRTLEGHAVPVTGIAFAPDGLNLASTAGRFDPRLWNRGEDAPMPRSLAEICTVTESLGKAQRDTQALALFVWLLGSARGFAIVGAPTLGAPPLLAQEVERAGGETPQHCDPAVAYSPDGRYLAASANLSLLSGEYHLLLVDLVRNEGRVVSGIYGCSVSFSHDGRFVATGGLGAPQLWDSDKGEAAQ